MWMTFRKPNRPRSHPSQKNLNTDNTEGNPIFAPCYLGLYSNRVFFRVGVRGIRGDDVADPPERAARS